MSWFPPLVQPSAFFHCVDLLVKLLSKTTHASLFVGIETFPTFAVTLLGRHLERLEKPTSCNLTRMTGNKKGLWWAEPGRRVRHMKLKGEGEGGLLTLGSLSQKGVGGRRDVVLGQAHGGWG